MASVTTAEFHELALEVEFDPVGASGTFTIIAGLKDVQINRSSEVDTVEVPDATDESQPFSRERAVRSQEVTASATGTWALESHTAMYDWWASGATLNARLRHVSAIAAATAGNLEQEAGPALLTSLGVSRTKGQKNEATIEIQWDGVPVATKTAP